MLWGANASKPPVWELRTETRFASLPSNRTEAKIHTLRLSPSAVSEEDMGGWTGRRDQSSEKCLCRILNYSCKLAEPRELFWLCPSCESVHAEPESGLLREFLRLVTRHITLGPANLGRARRWLHVHVS